MINNDKLVAIAKRAAWTFVQAFLAVFVANVTSGMAFADVDWVKIFEVGVVAGLLSVAKSFLVGIPEGSVDGTLHIDTSDPDKDTYLYEIEDLDSLKEKSTVTIKVDANGEKKNG